MQISLNPEKYLVRGCLAGIIFMVISYFVGFSLVLYQEYQSANYPGAEMISSHSNYSGLPKQLRWNQSYRTHDSFRKVYEWYSLRYEMGAENRANGSCIQLQSQLDGLIIKRYITVFLCGTSDGQLVFVDRTLQLFD